MSERIESYDAYVDCCYCGEMLLSDVEVIETEPELFPDGEGHTGDIRCYFICSECSGEMQDSIITVHYTGD